ncbi:MULTISPECIES: aldehyde dehydrogenase (NADP(+)) [unclassified Nocardioides]|uniref:aldehyde dehydrogenase (NADP(+)) n=1 Tax=unclassified Nocardioides TaxID=2615069 RepID=UPI0000570B5C|nr:MULTISPECIES: aldehyde dehydrogenase (NADP(+)) [unclassified Nocardioides]ABL79587.1 aldehyde dehydrogenase [Nocardioides sp. JS614]
MTTETTETTETVTGDQLVAGAATRGSSGVFHAVDPRTGEELATAFAEATVAEVDRAVEAAVDAFASFRDWDDARRADLLDAIAAALVHDGSAILSAVEAETALPRARAEGELVRTAEQFRAFARVLRQGWHRDALVDPPDPGAVPVPRPDVRRINVPVGPVAVFGASNFPLAFSTPGGDTAAALAAGCPVVVKGHPSHPATSELCGRAIVRALREHDAPAGTFSLLQSTRNEVGAALVQHPQVAAVGFTGSEAGGRALFDLASRRPTPIPVYAEMGSLNPVLVTVAALEARADAIAQGLSGSFLFCAGQYCTKPGLVLVPEGPAGDRFVGLLATTVREQEALPVLAANIGSAFDTSVGALEAALGDDAVVHGQARRRGLEREAALVVVDAARVREAPDLLVEHFGPLSVVVRYASPTDVLDVIAQVPGSLTATVHGEPDDHDLVRQLLPALVEKAGRVLWNGYPTGVSVTGAMMHGGPYPSSTFPAHTSVGWTAIRRFLRPVTFQNFPDELLPAPLRADNPLAAPRLVDGALSTGPS